MFNKLIPKEKSIVFTWLLSYALVLIVPVLISASTYFETSKVLAHEINNSNSLLIKKIQQQMDGILNDAERLSEEIALNTRISDLLKVKGSADSIPGYEIYLTVQDLRNFKAPNTSIDDYYVYFKNIDLVVSGNTSYDSRSFFDAYLSYSGIEYERWNSLISESYKDKYITAYNSGKTGKVNKTILFVRTIPFINNTNTSANIIISIDESRFMEDAKDIQSISEGSVLIINKNNEIIAASNAVKDIETIRHEDLKDHTGMIYRKLGGEKYVVSYTTSKREDWKYIAAVPYSAFWDKSEYIRKLTLTGLILCLIIGCFITYFSMKKNYNPLIKLVKLLEKKQGLSFDKKNNEYLFIQQVIDKVQSDKEKVDTIIKQQNKELRAELLNRILRGRIGGKLPVQDSLELHDITFLSEYFAVMVFYIDDFMEIFSQYEQVGEPENSYEKFKLVQFVVTNVVEEMVSQNNNHGFITDVDGMLVCLINFSEEGIKASREEMSRIAGESQQFLLKHFNINYMVAISKIHKTIAGIPSAYSEALQALEYKRVLGIDGIVYYEDILSLPKGDYYYPLEIEQQLINYIRVGDFEKSSAVLKDIFQKNFEKSILSIKIAKCLMFNLVSTMIKTVNEASLSGNNDFLDELNPVERLLGCENIMEMKQEMIDILDIFCNYIKSRSKNRNKGFDRKLVQNVIEYVNNNYFDPNLGVTTIAQEFNVHLVHLSKVFKENASEGLSDYINKVRLEKAKLLLNGTRSIDDVAREVGYSSIRTFARVFKKNEGITPGQFKELK